MVNSTVNGKKIGKAAGKDDKVKFTYSLCGKRNPKEKGLDTKITKRSWRDSWRNRRLCINKSISWRKS